jgi:hypothetical protein
MSPDPREKLPSSALPLVYFGAAHAGLAIACALLVAHPDVPGGYFLHPRMVAIVHLVTVPWITGSMLGACYLVGPLALGVRMPVGRPDWLACASFMMGAAGMVLGFWTGRYDRAAMAAALVLIPIAWVGVRITTGPGLAGIRPVLIHVRLAFANVLAAGLLGVVIGIDRATGIVGLSPVSAPAAHLHLAAIGWPVLMIVGLAYRLVPMFVPSRMPDASRLAASAVLIEAGVLVLTATLLEASRWVPLGAGLVIAGLLTFVGRLRGAVRQRLPRPPALPRRDWSTWQTHVAFAWLLVAVAAGAGVALLPAGDAELRLAWIYGVAGLVGFISQAIVGIQGRLVPMYAYYRAMAGRAGAPPARAANALPSPAFARPIFLTWSIGVPCLAAGLAFGHPAAIATSAAVLLAGVLIGAVYLIYLVRQAAAG